VVDYVKLQNLFREVPSRNGQDILLVLFLYFYSQYFCKFKVFMKRLFYHRRNGIYLSGLFFIVFTHLLTPLFLSAEVVDKVVAIVNNEVITLSELEEETNMVFRSMPPQEKANEPILDLLEKARKYSLDNLIERRLITQKAKKYNVTVSDEDVDAAYDRTRKNMSLNPEEFREKLERSGLTEESYRNKLKTQIMQSRLLSYDVRSRIVVTDEMILDYYDEHYTSKVDKGSYYLLQIGCSWSPTDDPNKLNSDKKATRERIKRIFDLAKSGQDFRTLAEKFSELPSASDGGDIGTFTLKEMAPAMRDVISQLKPGEISEIIETPSGYQFFKLLSGDKDAIVVTADFDAVKEEIGEKLFEEKLKTAYTEWVKKLKKDAYIEKL
jgi:peptidyl-prolyl cis-trans isomerase SurA